MFEWLLIGAASVVFNTTTLGMCEIPIPTLEEPKVEQSATHRVVKAEVSAYTSRPEETDDTPFITASGAITRPGVIACPSRLPFGTKVIINGKTYVCEDRMHERYRYQNVFDIWMPSVDKALAWGRRTINVRIVDG